MPRALWFLLLCILPASALASPAEVDRLIKAQTLRQEKWLIEQQLAQTAAQRAELNQRRPNSLETAREVWSLINRSLDREWTIEPAAWVLAQTAASGLPEFERPQQAIVAAFEAHHLKAPGIAPMCIALMQANEPRALSLLEKVQSQHPDKALQGIAAFCASMVLANLGDEPELIKKRLTYLRKAIIESADQAIGDTTIAELAEEELYQIMHLSKGRVAPELRGLDASGKPLELGDFAGKVVVLLFWNNHAATSDKVIEIAAEMDREFQGRPISVVGVHHGTLSSLRSLVADGRVTWPNFSDPRGELAKIYRVRSEPLVFVLDGKRAIQYIGALGSFAELTAEALAEQIEPKGGK